MAYRVVHKTIYQNACLLIGYGIHFWPFDNINHHKDGISVSGVVTYTATRVILLQLTLTSFYWAFSCNALSTVCYPIRHCMLTSNPITTLFQSFQHSVVTPRCLPLTPLWNSFKTSFILKEGTTVRLYKVLPTEFFLNDDISAISQKTNILLREHWLDCWLRTIKRQDKVGKNSVSLV